MSEAYYMGLRGPRCNGCNLKRYKFELGDKFLLLDNTVYELDAKPANGQIKPYEYKGRSIRFHAWFMSTEHSDECYNWKPPKK